MKIYVHHNYTYELFWYFFHSANIDPKKIPTWFEENRYNKNVKITKDVELSFDYNNHQFEVIFCGNRYWKNKDGNHLYDYNLDQLENDRVGDRGWNIILGKDLEHEIIPMINKYSRGLPQENKISMFFIDWEFGEPNQTEIIKRKLDKSVTIFKDELTNISDYQMVSFTHILWSFIFPNTINLREYYFLADYLKYKNDYEYRINYPIRRFTFQKFKMAKLIKSFNNPKFNCTASSFTDYYKHDRNDAKHDFLKKFLQMFGKKNYIEKRGYNIEDFGGEWNDNNMNEFMWKLFTISEINFLHEFSLGYNINEKSFSHILANKPFVPVSNGIYKFYNEIFKTYDLPLIETPLDDLTKNQIAIYLNEVSSDDIKWKVFYNQIQAITTQLREQLIFIMHHKNGYLDYLIASKYKKKSIL